MNLRILVIFSLICLGTVLRAQVSALFLVSPNEGCGSLTVSVTNQSFPIPIDTIIIKYGDGVTDTIVNPDYDQVFNHTYNTVGDFTIDFTAIKDGNVSSSQKQVNVYGFPDSDFDFDFYGYPSAEDTFYFSNRRYLFTAAYENDTIHKWWVNGILQEVQTNNLVVNFKKSGNQTIKHEISFNECSDDTSISVTVLEEDIKIPNIFTPNGDGDNDIFYIQTDGNMNYKFTVFNRHGSRVFVQEGQIISWDGRSYWGEELTPGNYYYVLEPDLGDVKRGFIFLSR
jgi:gliding motility-associated-like protein